MADNSNNPYQSPQDHSNLQAVDIHWSEETKGFIRGQLRIMQVISCALMMGLKTYASLTFFQASAQAKPTALSFELFLITAVLCLSAVSTALVLGFTGIGASRIVPRNDAPTGVDSRVVAACVNQNTRHIISNAICEGPGFFCIVLYNQSQKNAFLVLVGIILFSMLALFPTWGRLTSKIQRAIDI